MSNVGREVYVYENIYEDDDVSMYVVTMDSFSVKLEVQWLVKVFKVDGVPTLSDRWFISYGNNTRH